MFYVLVIICLILVQILVVLTWIMYQSNFGDSQLFFGLDRGTQREYSSKPLKHSTVKPILVVKR